MTYTHTHTCTYIYTHTYIYKQIHKCTYIYTHTYIYIYTNIHIYLLAIFTIAYNDAHLLGLIGLSQNHEKRNEYEITIHIQDD